ncbi:MAG: aminomethyl-transferring glycine dehydrogenase subunit GcvPA [Chloroflexi bacterium]|nr:MAG: aminomethyl-transferring glycine dehydrogenase subunit GcvPA [Chloroflexota bacterium]
MTYIPNTEQDQRAMLDTIGVEKVEDLFDVIPEQVRFPDLNLPAGMSELEVGKLLQDLAARNVNVMQQVSFLGAGAYHHYVPAVVDTILRRGEFLTAYTPYQAEVSQGMLTCIYEFQSLIAMLADMEVVNASMYDGASALAEAVLMAARVTRRDKVILSSAVHPDYRDVVRTYVQGMGIPVAEAAYDASSGLTDPAAVEALLDDDAACLVISYPNFFGGIEDLATMAELAHGAGALFVTVVNPIALGLLKPPGSFGADIVVGEGQPLGVPLQFGGPYLGLFATRKKHMRQMPGRLIGQTTDHDGRRGFVMTLQAREQHIRREKATSNICTNEALVALAATVYLAAMGSSGLRRAAELCYHKAHYAADRIASLAGYERVFDGPFFHEFAVRTPAPPGEVNTALSRHGIIGGYDLGRRYEELEGAMLFCVTEMNTRDQIDNLVDALSTIA